MTRRGTQDGTRSAKRTIGDEKILARARPIIAKLRIAVAEGGRQGVREPDWQRCIVFALATGLKKLKEMQGPERRRGCQRRRPGHEDHRAGADTGADQQPARDGRDSSGSRARRGTDRAQVVGGTVRAALALRRARSPRPTPPARRRPAREKTPMTNATRRYLQGAVPADRRPAGRGAVVLRPGRTRPSRPRCAAADGAAARTCRSSRSRRPARAEGLPARPVARVADPLVVGQPRERRLLHQHVLTGGASARSVRFEMEPRRHRHHDGADAGVFDRLPVAAVAPATAVPHAVRLGPRAIPAGIARNDLVPEPPQVPAVDPGDEPAAEGTRRGTGGRHGAIIGYAAP